MAQVDLRSLKEITKQMPLLNVVDDITTEVQTERV